MFILRLLSKLVGYKEKQAGGAIPAQTRKQLTRAEEEQRQEDYQRILEIL
jgi:hypothetical protein